MVKIAGRGVGGVAVSRWSGRGEGASARRGVTWEKDGPWGGCALGLEVSWRCVGDDDGDGAMGRCWRCDDGVGRRVKMVSGECARCWAYAQM